MIACKHLDPLCGIDIHIINIPTPGGPVPTPIPHPFVGMVIDPMDYVPILGATVLVNGLPRGQAGTAGKCLPPHIPLGGPFLKPPGNESENFMGSMSVLAEDEPFTYLGLPALSCSDIGTPPPPRPKKKGTKTKSLTLPTTVVLSVPAGPLVDVGGAPTISMMAMGMKAAMAGLGGAFKKLRKLQKSSKGMKKFSDKVHKAANKAMDKLGVPPNVRNKVHRGICSATGHPVDIATGKVFTEAVDFELPGLLPFRFERVWYSTSSYVGPLGRGWHHSYDMALIADPDAIAIRLGDGRSIPIPPLTVGEAYFDRRERLRIERQPGSFTVQDSAGIVFTFRPAGDDPEFHRLTSQRDRAGNTLTLEYDQDGSLRTLYDAAGRRIDFTITDGRITAISVPHPTTAGQRTTVARYEYDSDENLVCIRDAHDHPATYRYRDGLLVQETDRNGLSFYFEYDGVGTDARCTRTWGDGGLYDHALRYTDHEQCTTVTNSLGHETTYFWNDDGIVLKMRDSLGFESTRVFNEFNELLSEVDELGHETQYQYDDAGNRVLAAYPDGTTLDMEFNEHLQPVRVVDKLGEVWHWTYNSTAQLTSRTDPTGRTLRYLYTDGKLSGVVDPAGNATILRYDDLDNLVEVRTPDGRRKQAWFDNLGRIAAIEDPAGNRITLARDVYGRVLESRHPDGVVRRFDRDAMGNLTRATDQHREIHLTYSGMGRLASRSESGHTVEFLYDTEDNLISVRNEHRDVYEFDVDPRGDISAEIGFDGATREYEYDAARRLIGIKRPTGRTTTFEYDPLGRPTRAMHSDGSWEAITYRQDGEIIAAENASCSLQFDRDATGRVLTEKRDTYWISSEYDANGLRALVRTCFGDVHRIERDVMGRPVAISLDEEAGSDLTWRGDILRDHLGKEIERTLPGGVTSRWKRDRFGRPLARELDAGERSILDVRYEWDPSGRLRSVTDASRGRTEFVHDDLGNLIGAHYDDGYVEHRVPDAVGNLFRSTDQTDRVYDPAGRLIEVRGDRAIRYQYDADGNLVRKSTPEGDWLYRWNGSDMLSSVERPDGQVVTFHYDPFGRRMSKSFRGIVTRWLWDGNNPIHEWTESVPGEADEPPVAASTESLGVPHESGLAAHPARGPPQFQRPDDLITWIFDPGQFTPAAKAIGGRSHSIITDHAGAPTCMVDDRGEVTWRAELSIYGQARHVEGNAADCPFRWQGHYSDEETGLHYNRFRYYDPESGSYVSQDAFLGVVNWRAYSSVPDPNVSTDVFGLAPELPEPVVNSSFEHQGSTYEGVNPTARDPALKTNEVIEPPEGSNALYNGTTSNCHAEVEAMNKSYNAGNRGGKGVLTVEKLDVCPACRNSDVKKMALKLELDELEVHELNSGKTYKFKGPDDFQVKSKGGKSWGKACS